MDDLFQGDPMVRALLARIEALEAAVFAKAPKPTKESPEALGEAWAQWEAYRHGKGWTANARALNMRKLKELAGTDGALALRIVQQSIECGWRGLFPIKDVDAIFKGHPMPSPVQHKTVKQALAPTEDKRTAHLAWLRNQWERGQLSEDEYRDECRRVG